MDTRWATFAVVIPHLSLHQIPKDRLTDVPWLLDHAFTTAAVSHVSGHQNVPRAELAAAVVAQELNSQATLVTDSQYVIDCHNLIARTPDVRQLHKKHNLICCNGYISGIGKVNITCRSIK
jgi:hypothetical protein